MDGSLPKRIFTVILVVCIISAFTVGSVSANPYENEDGTYKEGWIVEFLKYVCKILPAKEINRISSDISPQPNLPQPHAYLCPWNEHLFLRQHSGDTYYHIDNSRYGFVFFYADTKHNRHSIFVTDKKEQTIITDSYIHPVRGKDGSIQVKLHRYMGVYQRGNKEQQLYATDGDFSYNHYTYDELLNGEIKFEEARDPEYYSDEEIQTMRGWYHNDEMISNSDDKEIPNLNSTDKEKQDYLDYLRRYLPEDEINITNMALPGPSARKFSDAFWYITTLFLDILHINNNAYRGALETIEYQGITYWIDYYLSGNFDPHTRIANRNSDGTLTIRDLTPHFDTDTQGYVNIRIAHYDVDNNLIDIDISHTQLTGHRDDSYQYINRELHAPESQQDNQIEKPEDEDKLIDEDDVPKEEEEKLIEEPVNNEQKIIDAVTSGITGSILVNEVANIALEGAAEAAAAKGAVDTGISVAGGMAGSGGAGGAGAGEAAGVAAGAGTTAACVTGVVVIVAFTALAIYCLVSDLKKEEKEIELSGKLMQNCNSLTVVCDGYDDIIVRLCERNSAFKKDKVKLIGASDNGIVKFDIPDGIGCIDCIRINVHGGYFDKNWNGNTDAIVQYPILSDESGKNLILFCEADYYDTEYTMMPHFELRRKLQGLSDS